MLRLILACVVATLLATASSAFAAGPRQEILRECQDGALTGSFTAKQIRDARDNIPTDVDQYTDCRDVLDRALLGVATGSNGAGGGSGTGSGGAGGPGGTGGSSGTGGTGGTGGGGLGGAGATGGGLITPTSPQDQQALAHAAKGPGAVDVGGTPIDAGATGLSAAHHSLPPSVIVALALLALAAAAGATASARRLGGLDPRGLVTLGRRVVARGR